MSFAALAGGSSCGPVNPLAQLSKVYTNDRGVQQDHFGPQAGSSRTGFRQDGRTSNAMPDEAHQFFGQQVPATQQPFDMAPLNRALTPIAAGNNVSTGSVAAPAWAQAFTRQTMSTPSSNSAEQDMFRRAFGGQHTAPAPQPQWAGDFQSHAQQQQQQQHQQHQQQHKYQAHAPASSQASMYTTGQARLYGAGFGGGQFSTMPMIRADSPMQQAQQHHNQNALHQHQDHATVTKDADWETAFKAQEEPIIMQDDPMTTTRPHSPIFSESEARDDIAQLAGALLNAVRSSEEEKSKVDNERSANDKFANSTFLDLMRKLRDGEVAVEGDKIVEQIGPSQSSLDKGKGRAVSDDWSNQFTSTREEEGRVGAMPTASTMQSGPALAAFAEAQHAFATRQSQTAQRNREMEKSYQEMAGLWDDEDQVREQREAQQLRRARSMFQGDGGLTEDEMMNEERTKEQMRVDTTVPLASSHWEEDFGDPSMISGGHAMQTGSRRRTFQLSAQQQEWDALQQDWDNFEATATGIKPVASTSSTIGGYSFAHNNPYVDNMTRHHAMHAQHSLAATTFDSVLRKEAQVQQDPRDPQAWLALGIKQQENEREDMAIKALKQAIELDKNMGEAYLALAVSYTNENERALAYESIDRWIDTLAASRYAREVDNYRDLFGTLPSTTSRDKHDYLTGLLIRLAQSRAEVDGADVDAEVQIGLGVLFNTSEEYEKAGDCFESALSVRPDDPLLFNRLGATFANSGKTEVAIQYYLEALDIQPGYVRARFNLAVANMNLGRYEEAVQHLLTSLSIQETEARHEADYDDVPPTGVTSQTLWDSLNICLLQMQRSDLSSLTNERNLHGRVSIDEIQQEQDCIRHMFPVPVLPADVAVDMKADKAEWRSWDTDRVRWRFM
ncbi:hypothetical protein OIO90_003436 [Microbotryomycetes sp. JL221]|nr:hypothetical protein OIO90_003436 [Microbotryomycetes sp. JL221]